MPWFNYYGLLMVLILMVPNIIFMMKTKDGFQNVWKNRLVETLEQIGRFGCFAFMIFNIPPTYFGFFFPNALMIYLIVNGSLLFLYCLIWALCFKKSSVFRSLALSILPSLLFVFSGIMIRSILLIIGSIILLHATYYYLIKIVKNNVKKFY